MLCYCKNEIETGARRILVSVAIDWGTQDLREPWAGEYQFCSFECIGRWAEDRSDDYDGHVLTDGRDERFGNAGIAPSIESVKVDRDTDRAIR